MATTPLLLLILLLFLLSPVSHAAWPVAEAHSLLTIKSVTLTLEPASDVARGADVTVRCHADVSSTTPGASLGRAYVVTKDNAVAYAKNTSSADDLLYRLPQARVTNTGKYRCQVNIQDKSASSHAHKLTVTGLSKPVLLLGRRVLSEGEELRASCSAPGESGPFVFSFFEDDREIHDETVNGNRAEATLRLGTVGFPRIHCAYTVIMVPDSVRSNLSDSVTVTVKALTFTPVLQISPEPTVSKIFEGDRVNLSCTVAGSFPNASDLKLFLSNGQRILSSGETRASHSLLLFSNNSGEFDCSLERGNLIKKRDVKTVVVHEIFSAPVLSLSQSEVFERDRFRVECHSAILGPERVEDGDIRYDIFKDDVLPGFPLAAVNDSVPRAGTRNYTCRATAGNIVKHSAKFVVRVKALASAPEILAVGRVVAGRPFLVRCHSERGSPPVTHTLWRKDAPADSSTVWAEREPAFFNVTVQRPEDAADLACRAQNNRRVEPAAGAPLNVSVIVPLSNATMTVLPPDVVEGDQLYLICGVQGSPPVTFTWFQDGRPVFSAPSPRRSWSHRVVAAAGRDSGVWHCEAVNDADVTVRSQQVAVQVKMAGWKRGLMAACCLLVVVAVVTLLCVLRLRAKRGRREAASELSVKPSSPKSDDSLTVSLAHDTEVYNAPKVGVDAGTVWRESPPHTGSDEDTTTGSNEPDVEYTEVVHPQPLDPTKAPLRKGTDTVYSELQNSPQSVGAPGHHDDGSVEYAELGVDQSERSVDQPECSVDQPECSVDQPECSVDQPECSVDQPELSVDQPELSDDQPECSVDQPECSVDQPELSVDQPELSVDQPELSVDQPELSDDQPECSVDQPELNDDQPEVYDLPAPVD